MKSTSDLVIATSASQQEIAAEIDAVIQNADLLQSFEHITDLYRYSVLPADWFVAVADVVNSTQAIADGDYKAVNLTGAAVITALHNVPAGANLPYVFGGDGAAAAMPSNLVDQARAALLGVKHLVKSSLGLNLRVALVPIVDIRQAGFDVRVARYAPSDGVWYAVFSGGGLTWAEDQVKLGHYLLEDEADHVEPNLSGLSCRWNRIHSRNGVILSLILKAPDDQATPEFLASVRRVIQFASSTQLSSNPMPDGGPDISWRAEGVDLEARMMRGLKALWRQWIETRLTTLFAWLVFKTKLRMGGFDPTRYRAYISKNADFQKYDDGLKMTLDLSEADAARLETELEKAVAAGHLEYGLHRQKNALITCLVPSVTDDRHFHFIDGDEGGYAVAASNRKRRFQR